MKNISVKEMEKIMKEKNPENEFIDVRSPSEFEEAHIPGTKNFPLDKILTYLPELKKKQNVYVNCRSGGRSAMAIRLLKTFGCKANLVNVEGGILEWSDQGFPVVSGNS